jgi:alpha-galactosidase
MIPTKIVVIGAGSASFGLNTLGAIMRSEVLRGSHLAMVDQNTASLELIHCLAQRLNQEWGSRMKLTTHTDHAEALDGAAFVVSAIEVPPRERLWRSDFEITLKYGLRQPYAENGGPGGFAHAARNIGPVLKIAHDMEKYCPDAWFINFTNPMMRICDAVARYSKIKVVGLCHQIYAGYAMVGYTLAQDLGIPLPEGEVCTHADPKYRAAMHFLARQAEQKVDIKAAGLNHFTWMVDIRDRSTGADLYPLFRQRWSELIQRDPGFEPLTQRVFAAYELFPIPGDEHLCEYLPWLSDPLTQPWEKMDISLYDWDRAEASRSAGHATIERMGRYEADIASLQEADSEGAVEVIENIAGAGNHCHLAANLPNQGYITNLPQGAIVEMPCVFSGMGARGVGMGDLPEGVAELCRREIAVTRLCVDAAAAGDRQKALQCLLFSPGVTDMDMAVKILDDYLETYSQYLPQFWR